MAGLLDSFFGNSFEDPKSQAVMALAGGLLSNDWRKGVNGYMQTMAAVPEANYEKAVRKAKLDELNAQAGLKQEQIRQSMAKAENEKRIRELVAGAGRQKMGMGAPSLLNESLPEGMRVGAMPQSQGDDIDYRGLMQQGVPFEVLKDLAATRNLGREEVARVQDIEGQGGAKILQGFDKYGRPVGQGATGYIQPQLVNQGDRQTFVKPMAGVSLPMGQSPDSKASNALGWANNSLSRERLTFDKQGGADGVKPKLVDGQWVTAPSDMKSGEVRPAMPSVAKKDATEALELIKSARKIIPESTGSYFGAGIDQVGRFFGGSTDGDTAAAQLKALEGSLVSKMPKMSGPQSDKDVALYKQMAGEIGDPTIPQSRKLAALKTIEEIQQRHSGIPATPEPSKPSKVIDALPPANNSNKGKRIRDTTTGKILKSNGISWVAE